jgi:hypothetical protein
VSFWKPARAIPPVLKAGQSQLADFERQPERTRRFCKSARASSPILKAARAYLAGFQKLFALQAKNLLIQYKIKGTIKNFLNICLTLS